MSLRLIFLTNIFPPVYNVPAMNGGILILDKPEGLTSRDVDNAVMKTALTRKVGHLGTLDPFATGVLVVAIGQGTKFLPYLGGKRKTYIASLILGSKTDTGDKTGRVVEEKEAPKLTQEAIESAIFSFLGRSKQLSPVYSALKTDGIPAYKMARLGKEVKRKERDIEVYSIRLLLHKGNRIDFSCEVSEGTYIRVLGEDIAMKLGAVGHLEKLRRVAVGPFSLKDARSFSKPNFLNPIDPTPYVDLPRVEADEAMALSAKQGKRLNLIGEAERYLIVREGKAVAVYRKEGESYRSERGLF